MLLLQPHGRGMHEQQTQNNDGEGVDLDAWLGKKNANARDESATIHSFSGGHESAMQQAKEFMSERFGIDIPDIQVDGKSDQVQSTTTPVTNVEDLGDPSPSPSSESPQTSMGSKTSGISEEILNSMPANVREIARRRPDLVNALLANTELPAVSRGIQLQESDIPSNAAYNEPLEVIDEEIGSWNEEPNSQEMTGLLRRRRNIS